MIQGDWRSSSWCDHLHISDGHHLPAASHPDVLLLLQGDQGSVEVHQEHVRPHQHEDVGSKHQLGANLPTKSLRSQIWREIKAIHYQAKIAIISTQSHTKSW